MPFVLSGLHPNGLAARSGVLIMVLPNGDTATPAADLVCYDFYKAVAPTGHV
jgi:hypothetical protein